MQSEVTVAGIDAARSGWVACTVFVDRPAHLAVGATLADVWDEDWGVVGIDMPMGLPVRERRAADTEARRLLGSRRSTLFPTPVHATLTAADYHDALARSRQVAGRGLSKQAYHLLARVRELRDWLGGPTGHVYEVHPETSFTIMNGGVPLPPKAGAEGQRARRRLLGAWSPGIESALSTMPASLVVDALDAGAASWTARRIQGDTHMVLGDDGIDPDGYRLSLSV